MRIFAHLQPGTLSRLQPELTCALDFLVFYFTVGGAGSSRRTLA